MTAVLANLLFNAITLLLYLYFYQRYFGRRQVSRGSMAAAYFTLLAACMIPRGVDNFIGNMIFTGSICFLITFLYQSTLPDRLMAWTYVYSVGCVTDMLATLITNVLDPELGGGPVAFSPFLAFARLLWLSFFFAFLKLGIRIFKGHEEYSAHQPAFLPWAMLLVPLSCAIIWNGLFQYIDLETGGMSVQHKAAFIALLLLYLLSLYFYQVLLRYGKLKFDNMLLARMDQYYHKEISLVMQHQKEIRTMKHDMKNHLITIRNLTMKEQRAEVMGYIDSMMGEMGTGHTIHSGNIIIDGILNSKIYEAEQYGTEITADMSIPPELKLNQTGMTIILGNLLDNAMDACKYLPPDRRKVRIGISWQQDVLMIEVENFLPGGFRKTGGHIRTTKKEPGHGLGLDSVSRVVEQNLGMMTINTEGKTEDGMSVFQVRILLYLDS